MSQATARTSAVPAGVRASSPAQAPAPVSAGRVGQARRPAPPTLWEEGRVPGPAVVLGAALAAVAVAWANIALAARLGSFFDLTFVVLCLVAALAVRPRDFFVVGVLPPLLMLGVVAMLALTARSAVADGADGLVQAVVSGLAHHAGALMAGYVPTLGVLAVRQAVMRAGRRGSAA